MPKIVRARSIKALQKITKSSQKTQVNFKCSCICIKSPEDNATKLTPQLEKASKEGWDFIKEVAFPSIPALLQDLWVYLELLITTLAFCLGVYGTFPIESNFAFQYTYFGLSVISMILALIDAYIYFVEVGSCARAYRYLKKKVNPESEQEENSELQRKTCCQQETK